MPVVLWSVPLKRGSLMRRQSLLPVLGLLAIGHVWIPAMAEDSFAVAPQQVVAFGDGGGDAFAVESISRQDNTVTVLLQPQGENCTFRFEVGVGRSVQLRTPTTTGQQMLCRATLQPLTDDGTAHFGAECSDEPISNEPKCPEGDTAANTYPQRP